MTSAKYYRFLKWASTLPLNQPVQVSVIRQAQDLRITHMTFYRYLRISTRSKLITYERLGAFSLGTNITRIDEITPTPPPSNRLMNYWNSIPTGRIKERLALIASDLNISPTYLGQSLLKAQAKGAAKSAYEVVYGRRRNVYYKLKNFDFESNRVIESESR